MDKKEIQSKLNQGYIHTRAIIEVIGKPKDYVQETIENYVQKIKKNKETIVISEDIAKVKPVEDLFSIFAEIEMLAADAKTLVAFCFDYMPASIEILAPEKLVYDTNDFTDFVNDLQARLHAVNMGLQDLKEHNKNLIKNTAVLLRNFVYQALRRPRDLSELRKIMGVDEAKLEKIVQGLIKEGKVQRTGDKYVLK